MTANTTTVLPDARALKPCPFCDGSEAFVEQSTFASSYVICNDCMARGPDATQTSDDEGEPGRDAAVTAWNQRTTQPTPDAAVPAGEIAAWLYIGTPNGQQWQVKRERGACPEGWTETPLYAAAPKVASEGAGVDVEEQARGLLRQQVGDGEKGVSITWGGNPSIDAHAALAAIRAALATDATDGATGGEVFDQRPAISSPEHGGEPSLRQLVRFYYGQHGQTDPDADTDAYFSALATTGADLLEQAAVEAVLHKRLPNADAQTIIAIADDLIRALSARNLTEGREK